MKNFSKITGILIFCLVAVVGLLSGMAAVIPADVMAAAPVLDAIGFGVQQPGLYLGVGMMVSLPKGMGAHRKGGPSDIKDVARVFRKRDVLYMPPRNQNGVLINGSVVMKPGTFMAALYGTQSTIEVKEMTEGNADQEGSKNTVSLVHPGSYLEVSEWYKANMHEDLYMIIVRCNGEMELYGDCANALRVKREKTINGTETSNKFTLESPIAGDVAAIYRGNITEDGFTATIATALPTTGSYPAHASVPVPNGRFLLPKEFPSNNSLLMGLICNGEPLPHGSIFTLVGGPGAGTSAYNSNEEGDNKWIQPEFGEFRFEPGVEATYQVYHVMEGTFPIVYYIQLSRYIP